MKTDSMVRVDLEDERKLKETFDLLQRLEFRAACLEVPPKTSPQRVERAKQLAPFRLHTRRTLRPKSREQLKSWLKYAAKEVDLVVVHSNDVQVLEAAIRDERVGALTITHGRSVASLPKGMLSLTQQHGKPVEVTFSQLLNQEGALRGRFLRQVVKVLRKVNTRRVSLIFGSEASEPTELFHPFHMVALAHELFDIPLPDARAGVNSNFTEMIRRIEARKDESHVMDGVRVLRSEE
ncbi:MAG: hypothetical protein Kow0069_32050 [Promethearchaeota archaeon]